MRLRGLPALRAPLARGSQRELDIAEGGEPGQQRVALEDDAAVEPRAVDRLAIDGDSALVLAVEPGDDREKRGLAAAGGADERDEFVLADGEVDALERDGLAAVGAESAPEAGDSRSLGSAAHAR